MKNLFILILCLFYTLGFATQQQVEITGETTIAELAVKYNIPVKKMVQLLELENIPSYDIHLAELGISSTEIKTAVDNYNQKKSSFYSGIIFVGMGIVFLSLIIVGIIISSLQHIGIHKKKKIISLKTSHGKVSALRRDFDSKEIIAAITAMYLHDAEAKNNIELTWKRDSVSLWRSAAMMENKYLTERSDIRGNR
ncbi:MAG: OadG family protein [Candidatus Cloacimonetes bacterium]|nr:OadG family protein [Candidatus Cloacimonadota bacterium]